MAEPDHSRPGEPRWVLILGSRQSGITRLVLKGQTLPTHLGATNGKGGRTCVRVLLIWSLPLPETC